MLLNRAKFAVFFFSWGLWFTPTVFASPVNGAIKTSPPGFSCAGALGSVKALLPNWEQQKASTIATVKNLSTYLTYYLRQPNALPARKNIFLSSSLDEMDFADQDAIASQIAGVLSDANVKDDAEELLKVGVSQNGTAAYQYITDLEKSLQTYHEMIARDDLHPELESDRNTLYALRMLAPIVTWASEKEFFSLMAHPDLGKFVASGLGIFWSWRLLSMASVPFESTTKEMMQFLTQAKIFMDTPSPEKRLLYFSHTYKILPSTFDKAWSTGGMDAESLINENSSYHRPLIPTSRKPVVSYVTFDYLLESSGLDAKDTSLHIFIRANKTKPKPKKPRMPKRVQSTAWQTSAGKLVTIPLPQR